MNHHEWNFLIAIISVTHILLSSHKNRNYLQSTERYVLIKSILFDPARALFHQSLAFLSKLVKELAVLCRTKEKVASICSFLSDLSFLLHDFYSCIQDECIRRDSQSSSALLFEFIRNFWMKIHHFHHRMTFFLSILGTLIFLEQDPQSDYLELDNTFSRNCIPI